MELQSQPPLDLDAFYGRSWDAMVAANRAPAPEVLSPDEAARLQDGVILHPLDVTLRALRHQQHDLAA